MRKLITKKITPRGEGCYLGQNVVAGMVLQQHSNLYTEDTQTEHILGTNHAPLPEGVYSEGCR